MAYQWYIGGISVVYQWKSVVKFGGMTSGILVIYQWYISGIPVAYRWYTSCMLVVYQWNIGGVTSGIPVEISGKIWSYYQWYTSGTQR